MEDLIKKYTKEVSEFNPINAIDLEMFRVRFLGSKGVLFQLFEQYKIADLKDKKRFATMMLEFKYLTEAKYEEIKQKLFTKN